MIKITPFRTVGMWYKIDPVQYEHETYLETRARLHEPIETNQYVSDVCKRFHVLFDDVRSKLMETHGSMMDYRYDVSDSCPDLSVDLQFYVRSGDWSDVRIGHNPDSKYQYLALPDSADDALLMEVINVVLGIAGIKPEV